MGYLSVSRRGGEARLSCVNSILFWAEAEAVSARKGGYWILQKTLSPNESAESDTWMLFC